MRLDLSRKTHLALRAMRALERSGEQVKGVDIASSIETTPQYLLQVMAPLVAAGWIASEPGPRGGYRLTQDLEVLSLLDVIEAVEGPLAEGRCVLRDTPCPNAEECQLHEPWQQARDALVDQLAQTPVTEEAGEAA